MLWYNIPVRKLWGCGIMDLDFFKDGNELKEKSKEQLIKEINSIKLKMKK
jgi:hypothetical protein